MESFLFFKRLSSSVLIFLFLISFISPPLLLAQEPAFSDLEDSQIKIVDDFDAQNKTNQVGGKWTASIGEGTELKFDYRRQDVLGSLRGSSLRIIYQVPAKNTARLETDLNGLDISQAKAMRFWMLRALEDEHRLFVTLSDRHGNSARLEVKRYSSAENERGWQEVQIPIEKFLGVDFAALKTFRLEVVGEEEGVASGIFFLDHLVFTGPPHLAFQSLADNLRDFPSVDFLNSKRREKLLKLSDKKLLREIARLTWGYFDNLIDRKTHLPVDNVQVGKFKAIGDYTSPTNIGLYLMACVSAYKLKFIEKKEAIGRIRDTFKTLKDLQRWNGFFYNFYNTTNLQITRKYVSTVDSGWLIAGLMVVKKAFPKQLAKQAQGFINDMDFSRFYTESLGQIRIGYDEVEEEMSSYHYGLMISESRVTSFIAIAKGDVPVEHWYRLYRSPPPDWEWQTQKPEGREIKLDGHSVFVGTYRYKDLLIVPSWGGSLFEFLMPTLVLKEKKLSPKALGRNDALAAKVHIDYALKEKGYPIWGLSPSSYPGGYGEFGVKSIGVKGYGDYGIITPHASLLALEFYPKAVIQNVRELIKRYPVLGEYGFLDSVKLRGEKVTPKYLALDQGMILVSITNYLKKGIIRKFFHNNSEIKRIEYLLKEERFFNPLSKKG